MSLVFMALQCILQIDFKSPKMVIASETFLNVGI